MLAHAYNIIIDNSFGATGHSREIIYHLNANDKSFLSILTKKMQQIGVETYGIHMEMYTSTANTDTNIKK